MNRLARLKELTERINEQEAQVHAFFQRGPDVLLVLDKNNNIVRTNGRSYEVLGWQPDDLQGTSIYSLLQSVEGESIVFPHVPDRGNTRFLANMQTKGGHYVPLDFNSTYIPEGDVVFVTARLPKNYTGNQI